MAKFEKKVDEKISSMLVQSNKFATSKVTTAVKNLATKVTVDAVRTGLSKLQSAISLDIRGLEGKVSELRAELTSAGHATGENGVTKVSFEKLLQQVHAIETDGVLRIRYALWRTAWKR